MVIFQVDDVRGRTMCGAVSVMIMITRKMSGNLK
jgi:hypothetical protein